MRGRLKIFVSIAFLCAACVASTLARASDGRAEFVKENSCRLAGNLQAAYKSADSFEERDRYVVLSRSGQLNSYVQCSFVADRKRLRCEASSSYYAQSGNSTRLIYPSADEKNALERLGFDIGDGVKNYRYERDLPNTPDFGDIARLMLLALHDGFGARSDMPLTIRALFTGTLITACRY